MAQPPPVPSMDLIQRHADAVNTSFGLLAGMQLDLFTPLREGPLTCEQIAEAIGVDPTRLRPLLYILVTAQLLTVDGDRFANSAVAGHYLVRGEPDYMGSRHELLADLWSGMLKTAESIRIGRAQAKHDFSAMPPSELKAFFRGLSATATRHGRMLAEQFDFSGYRRLLDVGGGSSHLAIAITEACPQLRATVVDLPTVTPLTQEFVDEAGAAARVRVLTADLTREPVAGTFDVAVLKNLIQTLSADQARAVLQHVGAAVEPGGAIYILGSILDDSRLSPPAVVGMNLVFLNIYEGGQAYTEGEHRAWLAEAGFGDAVRTTLRDGAGLMAARRLG